MTGEPLGIENQSNLEKTFFLFKKEEEEESNQNESENLRVEVEKIVFKERHSLLFVLPHLKLVLNPIYCDLNRCGYYPFLGGHT